MNMVNKIEKENIEKIGNKLALDTEKDQVNQDILNNYNKRNNMFKVGDLVKIFYKIIEGKRERIQVYEGYVISFKGKGLTRSFKVRKISYGLGVERTFPLYSPNIAKIELVRKGKIRRAKLYYLRERSGKRAVIKEKINFKKHQTGAASVPSVEKNKTSDA